jgi:hypothetical protein
METRFMLRIYVRHTFLSSTKRTRAETKFAELESALLVSATRESAAHFSSDLQRILQASPAVAFIAKSREIVRGRIEKGRVVRPEK